MKKLENIIYNTINPKKSKTHNKLALLQEIITCYIKTGNAKNVKSLLEETNKTDYSLLKNLSILYDAFSVTEWHSVDFDSDRKILTRYRSEEIVDIFKILIPLAKDETAKKCYIKFIANLLYLSGINDIPISELRWSFDIPNIFIVADYQKMILDELRDGLSLNSIFFITLHINDFIKIDKRDEYIVSKLNNESSLILDRQNDVEFFYNISKNIFELFTNKKLKNIGEFLETLDVDTINDLTEEQMITFKLKFY